MSDHSDVDGASDSPTVSVLLAARNAERHLRQAVRSVLCQSLANFELLLRDDGSTDGTAEIIRQESVADRRVSAFSGECIGLTRSLNDLSRYARGRYFARMDADDLCHPDRFLWQVEFLERRAEVVAVGGWVFQIDEAGRPLCPLKPPLTHTEIDAFNLAGRGGGIIHPTAMIRAAALRDLGGYDENLGTAQDLDLFLRLAECGRLANLQRVVLLYRRHPRSVSRSQAERQWQSAHEILRRAARRRGLEEPGPLPWRPESPAEFVESQMCHALTQPGSQATALHYAIRLLRQPSRRKSALHGLAKSIAQMAFGGQTIPKLPNDFDVQHLRNWFERLPADC